jgi:hypothetical protein
MALKYFPVPNAGFAFTTKPVVSADSQLLHEPKPQDNGGNIAQQDIREDVVPPTLSEVMQSVLRGQLNNLVKDVPEMEDVRVPNDKGGKNPINPMNQVVMVHVVP